VKKLGIALLVVVGSVIGLVVIAAIALALYAGTEYTVCYGAFKSKAAAERAAEAGDEADFNTSTEHRKDDQGSFWGVDFRTGETGDDARELRRAFRDIIRRERGEFGHPDGGCLEREPFGG
jgi:hypothetical protein